MHPKLFLPLLFIFAFTAAFPQSGKLQKFIERYEQFRYSLYPELEQPQGALQHNSAINRKIESFLKVNREHIVKYRNYVLEKNLRSEPEDHGGLYKLLPEEEFDKINQTLFLINASEQSDALHPFLSLSLIEFTSINPVEFIETVNASVDQQIIFNTFNLSGKELGEHYFKSMVGGKYIVAERMDNDNWELKINAYYYATTYRFNVVTGEAALKEIMVRKTSPNE